MQDQAYEGDLSPRILREARGFVDDLRAKLAAQPLKDPDHQKEAQRFLTACTSLLNLLEMPNIRPALLELKKVQDTTIGNLLGFMSAFNLRFGPATSPSQRQVYSQLFQILNQTRDRILAEAKLETTAPAAADTKSAIDFFQKVDQARSKTAASPEPAKPATPK